MEDFMDQLKRIRPFVEKEYISEEEEIQHLSYVC